MKIWRGSAVAQRGSIRAGHVLCLGLRQDCAEPLQIVREIRLQ